LRCAGLGQTAQRCKSNGNEELKVTPEITPLIAGNWKMNGLSASLGEVHKLAGMLTSNSPPRCTVAICPPATLLMEMTRLAAPSGIVIGGQDCHPAAHGPHTGAISAAMLADAGAHYVIVGHSERRTGEGETDLLVRRKAQAAMGATLTPIICIGESEAERREGKAEEVVARQLQDSVPDEARGMPIVIAYEPVWAIGTGLTPTSEDISRMHGMIRQGLTQRFPEHGPATPILYGGSLKPVNAHEILRVDNVNGGLVGGASLLANDFYAIISAI
jgi:triosephosphate isomerase (TIM)